MKKIIFMAILAIIALAGCKKYDDSYLDAKLPQTIAYFASFQEYTRTVVVGEGLTFKIGAAMAGVIKNTEDRTVDFQIGDTLYQTSPTDGRILLPATHYNSSSLGKEIRATIPAGEFLGYFSVVLDSMKFLNDPTSLGGKYTIPVKIVGTSLDSIEKGLDSIKVSVSYMAGTDGYYLYQSVIKKEVAGSIIDSKTIIDSSLNEADNSTWRLLTRGPFKVEAAAAVSSFTSGLKFNLIIQGQTVSYEAVAGQPVITPEGTNTYDPALRNLVINYNYQQPGITDTIYHVSSKLIFRNRLRDRLNETREYLLGLNNQ